MLIFLEIVYLKKNPLIMDKITYWDSLGAIIILKNSI